jgi:hypothetical protein
MKGHIETLDKFFLLILLVRRNSIEKIQIVCLRGIGSGKSFLCEGEKAKESKEKG